jgi:hypothetical protein
MYKAGVCPKWYFNSVISIIDIASVHLSSGTPGKVGSIAGKVGSIYG